MSDESIVIGWVRAAFVCVFIAECVLYAATMPAWLVVLPASMAAFFASSLPVFISRWSDRRGFEGSNT